MIQPKVGDLVKIINPTWSWVKPGDMGVIVQLKELKECAVKGVRTPTSSSWRGRYLYQIRFARGPLRLANAHEFEVINGKII